MTHPHPEFWRLLSRLFDGQRRVEEPEKRDQRQTKLGWDVAATQEEEEMGRKWSEKVAPLDTAIDCIISCGQDLRWRPQEEANKCKLSTHSTLVICEKRLEKKRRLKSFFQNLMTGICFCSFFFPSFLSLIWFRMSPQLLRWNILFFLLPSTSHWWNWDAVVRRFCCFQAVRGRRWKSVSGRGWRIPLRRYFSRVSDFDWKRKRKNDYLEGWFSVPSITWRWENVFDSRHQLYSDLTN